MNISVHQHIMQLCKCAQCLSCRRTCTLIFLCCSLGGVWSLEQPSGSLLEFYPTWRFTLNAICKCLGHHSVRVLFFNGGTMYRIYQTDFILMPLIQSSCNQMIYIYIYIGLLYIICCSWDKPIYYTVYIQKPHWVSAFVQQHQLVFTFIRLSVINLGPCGQMVDEAL